MNPRRDVASRESRDARSEGGWRWWSGSVAAAVDAAVSGCWEFRNAYRRQLLALSCRIRLLEPFAEELREAHEGPAEEEQEWALAPLADTLGAALDLLRLGRDGSRIFLIWMRMEYGMDIYGHVRRVGATASPSHIFTIPATLCYAAAILPPHIFTIPLMVCYVAKIKKSETFSLEAGEEPCNC